MTLKKKDYEEFLEAEKFRGLENLKKRPNQRLTCCVCKNQTFLLVYGVADFPFFDLFCSKCGGSYPVKIGK